MARRLRQSLFAAVLFAAIPISASAQNGAEGADMTRPVVFPSVSGRIAYQANGGTKFASGGSGGMSGAAAAATITIGGGDAGF